MKPEHCSGFFYFYNLPIFYKCQLGDRILKNIKFYVRKCSFKLYSRKLFR